MLRRTDVELEPGEIPNNFFTRADFEFHDLGHRVERFAVDAHAVALHRGENGRERQIDRLVKFREALRLHFLAQERREALQMFRMFSGSAGERDAFLAQHRIGQAVFRGCGPQQVGIEHRRVADSGDGARQQLEQFWIVHNFGALFVLQKFGERGLHFSLFVEPRRARYAWLRGNFNRGDLRAEAFFFAISLGKRQPDGGFGVARNGAQIFFQRRGRFQFCGIAWRGGSGGSGSRRGQIAQQRSESQLRVNRAQRFHVRRARLKIVEHEFHRRGGVDDGKLFRHNHRVAAVFERFAIPFSFDFLRAIERRFRGTKAADQFLRAFFADAFRAGNVVDRIAHERHHVGDFFGRHAHQLFHFCRVDNQVGFIGPRAGTQHAHVSADELHHVLVARDDGNVEALFRALLGERANHVIRFKSGKFEDGQPHGFAHPPHIRKLHGKIVGHRRPLRLVLVKKFVAKCRFLRIEHHGEIIRRVLLLNLAQHVGEQVGHFRGNALRAIQPRHRRKVGAKDKSHRVHKKKFFRCRSGFGHRPEYSKAARAAGVCYFIGSRFFETNRSHPPSHA